MTLHLAEVAPRSPRTARFAEYPKDANARANPELVRLALVTGAGKTTAMAMLIAWRTVNAVRRPKSRDFSRGFSCWPHDVSTHGR